ncbi:hypothetical protein ACXYMO_15740 [Arenibacterium sp. CAU 1754]
MLQILDAPEQSPARRLAALRKKLIRLKSSNYDVSNTCNLTCEGCLYFAKPAKDRIDSEAGDITWDTLFKAEAERGINFAYLAGAEPSMTMERVRAAARHIPYGVVFTNGTRRIDADIPYRLHVSMWGLGDNSDKLRGADVNAKAFRNYAGDDRAVLVFTVNAQNTHEIVEVSRLGHEHGLPVTFNFFSPTEEYNVFMASRANKDNQYFRLGDGDGDLRHNAASFARAKDQIDEARTLYPDTVRYSPHYHDWITQPLDQVMEFDENNVAIDCGNRLTKWHRHYKSDATISEEKCCSPNLDCRECRGYAMGYATYFRRYHTFKHDRESARQWLEGLELWADLFLPRNM